MSVQEGDVIELCQVSDIRAGGVPKVSGCQYYAIIFEQKKNNNKIPFAIDWWWHIYAYHIVPLSLSMPFENDVTI